MYAGSCPSSGPIHCYNYENSHSGEVLGETEDGFCEIVQDLVGIQSLGYKTSFTFCLTYYNPNYFDLLQGVDGYLGMGYMTVGEGIHFLEETNNLKVANHFFNILSFLDRNIFPYWMSLLPPEWPKVFGLQLSGNNNSLLHVGGYDHYHDIVWSEKQTNIDTEMPVFIEAPLYHISYCGEELLPTTAFTSAQFVSYRNCLGLSQDLFPRVSKNITLQM